MMEIAIGEPPRMWGSSIVGCGSYHYKYESGREGDMPKLGFAPRKGALTLYTMGGWDVTLLAKLGKHTTGKGCLYIKKLADVDGGVLQQLLSNARVAGAVRIALEEKSEADKLAGKTAPKKPMQKVEVLKPNKPDYKARVDAAPYSAMKKAMLKVLPKKSPGITEIDLFAALAPQLPKDMFPGGALVIWWAKCVHADLEARGITVREPGRPVRWHKA